MKSNITIETSVRDFLRVLFRHKIIFVLFFVLIIPSVYIRQELKTPISSAQVKMYVKGVKPSEADYYKGVYGSAQYIASTQSSLIYTRVITDRVVKALKLYQRPLDFDEMNVASRLKRYFIKNNIKRIELTLKEMTAVQRQEFLYNRAVENLNGHIESFVMPETELFIVSVQDYNRNAARIIVNSLSRSFIIFDLEQQIAELTLKYGEKHSTVIQLKAHIEELYETLDGRELPFIKSIGPASIKIIEQARIGAVRGRVNKNAGLILAFLISLFGSIGTAFVLDYLSQTINSPKDIEKYLNIPCLGSIPKVKSNNKLNFNNPGSKNNLTNFYQSISNQLDLLTRDENSRTVLFTDAEASRDTANVVANIGLSLTHNSLNKRILIIDANLREPSISEILNIDNTHGLANVLEGKVLFEDAVQNVGVNMDVLCAGQFDINPVILIDSPMMKDVINKAKKIYETILINSADLKNFNDAVILSSLADGLILVVNEGKVKHQIVQMAIAPLEKNKINYSAAILNNCKMVIPELIYKRI